MRATRPVSDRTREVLATAEVHGHHVRLTEQLTSKDYKNVDTALRALGGTWNRAAQAHVFDSDPTAALAAVLAGGDIPGTVQAVEGYVATPAELADWVLRHHTDLDALPEGARVLEPSAGDGAFVRAILKINPQVRVTAIEPNAERAALIEEHPQVDPVLGTLEAFAASTARPRFDAVVMNPPFALPHDNTAWITHLTLAWNLLADGGRLVAIVPAGFLFRKDRKHTAMRELITGHGGHMELPDGAFGTSHKGIRTVVVWADRPETTG
jgi:hypothetical protein